MSNEDYDEEVTMGEPCHPGEVMRDWIDGHGETVTNAAKRLGVSRSTLNRLLAEKAPMTAPMALRLESLGWSNAEF